MSKLKTPVDQAATLPPEVDRIINGVGPSGGIVTRPDTPSGATLPAGNGQAKPPAGDVSEVQTVLLEIPLVRAGLEGIFSVGPRGDDVMSRYPKPHLDVDLKKGSEKLFTMQRFLFGLRATNQRLRNDMPIRSAADAIRWLLEKMEVSCE